MSHGMDLAGPRAPAGWPVDLMRRPTTVDAPLTRWGFEDAQAIVALHPRRWVEMNPLPPPPTPGPPFTPTTKADPATIERSKRQAMVRQGLALTLLAILFAAAALILFVVI